MFSGDARGGTDFGDQGLQAHLSGHHQGEGQGRHGHLLLGGAPGDNQQRPQQRPRRRRQTDAVVASERRTDNDEFDVDRHCVGDDVKIVTLKDKTKC
jgi:hypothetical protein